MKDDMFIFDCVVHMYDNTPENVANADGERVLRRMFEGNRGLSRPPEIRLDEQFIGRRLPVEEAHKTLFEDACTDMAMAQVVPLRGWWKNGFSPVEANHALAAAYRDRVLFCGGVDPIYDGVDGAVEELERQVVELGAVSMKYYQVHPRGLHWRADDRLLAYPMWEKCLELGVNVVQFHKGFPFGTEHIEDLRSFDIQDAAVDFPEMNFVIHHLGLPFVDETIAIAMRFPNVHLALSGWFNVYPFKPMEALHQIGKALQWVGPDRLFYGSEAFAWLTLQPYIDMFAEMQMPAELQDGYGYPELTSEIKRKIFGENFARLMGIDLDAKKKELGLAA